jgi:putative addiction module component (TIGR02574 family)
MPTALAEVEQKARTLSPDDQARLAEVLLKTLQGDTILKTIEMAWQQEIEKRVAAYDRGEVKTYAADEVFVEAGRVEDPSPDVCPFLGSISQR